MSGTSVELPAEIVAAIDDLIQDAIDTYANESAAEGTMDKARADLIAKIAAWGQKQWDDAIQYTLSEARDHD